MSFLRSKGTQLIRQGDPLSLRGINLGGWLMMEAYILHAPNFPEQKFKKEFQQAQGLSALGDFERAFRDAFVNEKDFALIAQLGFNCVRVPFNANLIERQPFQYDLSGIKYLDEVMRWANQYHLWIILDLHAAPGAQNHDWHSDSLGQADLWMNTEKQKQTLALWEFIANRYKGEEWLAGYDLLNEAVIGNVDKLNRFYKEIIKTIRKVDKNHILFIEGNNWATDIECLEDFEDDNYALSVHMYHPVDLTLNFVPQLKYQQQQKMEITKLLDKYVQTAQKRKRPVFVGEFGVNSREGHDGEDRWLADALQLFNGHNFHWTYWTYKAVKNSGFPDGFFSYFQNPPWVHRQGPLMGWDTYHLHWPLHKETMIESWKTENFKVNVRIQEILKEFC